MVIQVGSSDLKLLLAQIGTKVIFLDNDPQGNSTKWFLNRLTDADYPLILEELQTKNLYNLLQERISPQNALLALPETSLKLLAATPNYEQAKTRADPSSQDKGGGAAMATLRLIELKIKFLVQYQIYLLQQPIQA